MSARSRPHRPTPKRPGRTRANGANGPRDESGVALALAVAIMFLVVILGLTSVSQTTSAIFQSRNAMNTVTRNLAGEAPKVSMTGTTANAGAAGTTTCASSSVAAPAGAFSTDAAQCATGLSASGGATGLTIAGQSTTTASSATTTIVSSGSVAPTNLTTTATACGVAQISDTAAGGTDTALLYGGATYGTRFAPLNSTAMTFDGTDAWGETLNSIAGPNTFTLTAWFRTTASGSIMGFSNAQGVTGQSDWDRMLWVDPSGHVVFGTYPSGFATVTSPGSYADGNWHMAAATVSSTGGTLYVDGAAVATAGNMTGGQAYSGWWHIGWSNAVTSWPDLPTSAFFPGSIADLADFPTALTAAQIGALYTASGSAVGVAYNPATPTNFTNPGTYNTLQAADGPTDVWAMSENGGTPYTAALPGVAPTSTLADTSGNGNTGMPQGGVTLGSAGPFGSGSLGVTLDGATGSYIETTKSYANPTPFTEMAWFKTSSDGGIMGFDTNQTDGGPSNWDRMVFVDNTGHLVFGVYASSTIQEVTSPKTYWDNSWHQVIATLGSTGGERLYVDGSLVASNANVTTAENQTEYWHLGFAYMSGWTDAASNIYFTGSLAQQAIFPTQLTAVQVTSLYGARTSDAAMSSQVLSLAPTSYWPLNQVGTGLCGQVEMTVQANLNSGSQQCLLPSNSGTCPGLTTTTTAANLPFSSWTTTGVALVSDTLTVTTALIGTPPSGAVGLHIVSSFAVVGSGVVGTNGTGTAQLVWAQTGAEL
jgi:hypothetical protein